MSSYKVRVAELEGMLRGVSAEEPSAVRVASKWKNACGGGSCQCGGSCGCGSEKKPQPLILVPDYGESDAALPREFTEKFAGSWKPDDKGVHWRRERHGT